MMLLRIGLIDVGLLVPWSLVFTYSLLDLCFPVYSVFWGIRSSVAAISRAFVIFGIRRLVFC